MVGPYTRYGPPLTSQRPAPLAGAFDSGANTRAILTEIGFAADEIDALVDGNVVAEASARD